MAHQKDPMDKFVEGLFYAAATAVWAFTAATGSLIVRLLRTPPEKRLKKMKRNSGWGEQVQTKACSRCETPNDADTPLCNTCGARF